MQNDCVHKLQPQPNTKNTIIGALHRERKRGATTNAAIIKPHWDTEVSSTIAEWSFGHIPEACWGVAGTESEYLFNSNTSSIELSDAGRALGMREYEFEPRSHAEAMARPSERTFWAEAEEVSLRLKTVRTTVEQTRL